MFVTCTSSSTAPKKLVDYGTVSEQRNLMFLRHAAYSVQQFVCPFILQLYTLYFTGFLGTLTATVCMRATLTDSPHEDVFLLTVKLFNDTK